MKLNKLLLIVVIGIISINFIFQTSCKKKQNPRAIITITDSLDYKIKNVKVVVFVSDSVESGIYINPNTKQFADTAYTDASGKVEFEFVNEAIFKVYAEKIIGQNIYFGENVIVLKENEITEKTIILEKKQIVK